LAQVLVQLLKHGSEDLLRELFRRHNFDPGTFPTKAKARLKFNAEIFGRLAFQESGPFPELTRAAERVDALADGRFDWIFARIGAKTADQSWQNFDSWNRALWFLLHEPELLERIERKASYEQYSTQRNKHTRFQTKDGAGFNRDREVVASFETQLKLIYKKHDGSGLFAETEIETGEGRDGKPQNLISVGISQLPASLEHINEKGERKTEVVRKITDVHVTYDSLTGELFVVASRGGYPVRKSVAEAFATYILGIEDAPVVIAAERFRLDRLLAPEYLAPLPDIDLKGIDLIELHIRHPDFDGTAMTFRDTTGLPADLLARLFGESAAFVSITSASVRLHFDVSDDDGPEPKPLVATFNADGSTTLRGDLSQERRIREAAPQAWGLIAPSPNG
tara:strand:+ start:4880 stop:6061 length:1182 start_codon:yes stop_codon:yes gene_type:complete